MNGNPFRHVPNLLTLLRIFAVPVFIGLMLNGKLSAAAWVFFLAAATDVLDGFIARRFGFISAFGKLMDPVADKLMLLAALFMLAWSGLIMPVIPWLVLAKELFLLVSGFALIRRKSSLDMSARWFGKLTSVLFFVAISLTFFGRSKEIIDLLLWLSLGMALFAAGMYSLRYLKHRRDSK